MMATIGSDPMPAAGRWPLVSADGDEQREGCAPERSLGEGVEGHAPDEGPDEPAVESNGDGPDDRQDEDEMRLGIAHPEVLRDGRFNDGGHRRSDRGDEQGHGRSDPRRAQGRALIVRDV